MRTTSPTRMTLPFRSKGLCGFIGLRSIAALERRGPPTLPRSAAAFCPASARWAGYT
jgi:hypothetical protein